MERSNSVNVFEVFFNLLEFSKDVLCIVFEEGELFSTFPFCCCLQNAR